MHKRVKVSLLIYLCACKFAYRPINCYVSEILFPTSEFDYFISVV